MFIPFNRIDASRWMVGGRTDRNGGGGNDIEPMIRVEIAAMRAVTAEMPTIEK
jgi:hypothetical protein